MFKKLIFNFFKLFRKPLVNEPPRTNIVSFGRECGGRNYWI